MMQRGIFFFEGLIPWHFSQQIRRISKVTYFQKHKSFLTLSSTCMPLQSLWTLKNAAMLKKSKKNEID